MFNVIIDSLSMIVSGRGGWVYTESWRAERKEDHETAAEDKKWNTPHEKGYYGLLYKNSHKNKNLLAYCY